MRRTSTDDLGFWEPALSYFLEILRPQRHQKPKTRISSPDWDKIVLFCREGHVADRVLGSLSSLDDVPSTARRALLAQALLAEERSARAYEQLADLCGAFEHAGIRLVSLKGADLLIQNTGIGRLPARWMADLDLLVHPDHLESGERVLRAQGYSSEGDRAYLLRFHHHLMYSHPDTRKLDIDLHWTPHLRTHTHFNSIEVFERLEQKDWNGSTVWAMCREDQLLAHLLHLASHHFRVPFKNILDIFDLADNPNLDEALLLSIVHSTQTTCAVYLCLLFLEMFYPLPPFLETIRAELALSAHHRKNVLRRIRPYSFTAPQTPDHLFIRVMLDFALRSSTFQGIGVLIYKACKRIEEQTGLPFDPARGMSSYSKVRGH